MYKWMPRTLALAGITVLLSACGSTQVNMIQMQTETAKTLGLASSDEITVSNINYQKKNSIGGSQLTYDATTARGRKFACSAFVMAGLTPLDEAAWTDGKCTQK
ncbi:hypothetical protein [Pseudomonas bohemica]|uniref:hypothetical protein n=1 Tax=Pseudomonas bohemica TaxID=2044872 RepID=UPI000DA604E8|nr:hypothetical protein [Pseudomonas bohemica]